MPLISSTIEKGPLSIPERAVLEVITRNSPPFVWSTSLEDLYELAKWAAFPDSNSIPATPEELIQLNKGLKPEPTGLTINTKVEVVGSDSEIRSTYSLRTIMAALSRLHRTGRIWGYKVYKRTHYGRPSAYGQVIQALGRLSAEEQAVANFTPLEPEQGSST